MGNQWVTTAKELRGNVPNIHTGDSMSTYYDYVLWSIPTILFGVGGLLWAVGLPARIALAIGALLALGVMVHALFVNAPVDQATRARDRATSASDRPSGATDGPSERRPPGSAAD